MKTFENEHLAGIKFHGNGTFNVISLFGTLECDRVTGKVDAAKSTYEDNSLKVIKTVDIDQFRKDYPEYDLVYGVDILDIGLRGQNGQTIL